MRLRDIDFNEIQTALTEAECQAERIRRILGLPNLSITDNNFFDYIFKRLDNLHFDVIYTNKLKNIPSYGHLPSLVTFNDQYDRSAGGHIYIYDKYSKRKRKELILHEFVHIHDNFTPWSTDSTNGENVNMLTKFIIKAVELRTELVSLELMMPTEEFKNNLSLYSYDINKIASLYRAIKTSTVVIWIMLHNDFYAHFAIIYFLNLKPEIKLKIDEYRSNTTTFEILDILSNKNSMAYNSRSNRMSVSGVSAINNINYHCFCFYEKDIQQPLPSSVSTAETIVPCDEMVIIGWSKNIYDIIKNLKAQP